MPIVQETVTDPAGNALPEVQIDIVLIGSIEADGNAPGYASSPNTILGRWRTWTDAEGQWSADLIANSALEPDNTYYTLTRKGRGAESNEALLVPSGTATYWVHEVLTVPPLTLPTFLSDAAALALASPAAAGSGGKGAREDHVHPTTGLAVLASDNTFLDDVHIKGPTPWIDVKAYGAVANGAAHLLSARFATIAAARLAYPLTHAYLTANSLPALALTDESDWAAIQEAVLAAGQGKGRVYLSQGTANYRINRTIYIGGPHFGPADRQGIAGLSIRGDGGQYFQTSHPGTILFWVGNATDPMLKLMDVQTSEFEDFLIQATVAIPLKIGVWTENTAIGAVAGVGGTSGAVTPKENIARRVNIDGGTFGVEIGWYAPDAVTNDGTKDANNDYWHFYDCVVSNYKTGGWLINNPQAVTWQMDNCLGRPGVNDWARVIVGCGYEYVHGSTPNTGTQRLFGGGSFIWRGGGGGGVGTALEADIDNVPQSADFILGGQTSHHILIEGGNFEGSTRLLYVHGPSSAPVPVSVVANRWSHYSDEIRLCADGYFIRHQASGPLVVSGNRFVDGGTGRNMRILVSAGSQTPCTATVDGNIVGSNDRSKLLEAPGGNGLFNIVQRQNICVRTSDGVVFAFPNTGIPMGQGVITTGFTLNFLDAGSVVPVNAATDQTITLPSAALFARARFTVMKLGGAGNVLIATTSSQTINGLAASAYVLTRPYSRLTVESDGANWFTPTRLRQQRTVAADTTLDVRDDDSLVLVDTSAAGKTITLPTAVGIKGVRFTIKRVGASTVTLAATSAQTIDGAAASTFNIASNYGIVTVESDGSNWLKLN